jgi:hypothetical protein
MIGVFIGFSRIYLLGILIFKGLTARRLYKSFGAKGLIPLIFGYVHAICMSTYCTANVHVNKHRVSCQDIIETR